MNIWKLDSQLAPSGVIGHNGALWAPCLWLNVICNTYFPFYTHLLGQEEWLQAQSFTDGRSVPHEVLEIERKFDEDGLVRGRHSCFMSTAFGFDM